MKALNLLHFCDNNCVQNKSHTSSSYRAPLPPPRSLTKELNISKTDQDMTTELSDFSYNLSGNILVVVNGMLTLKLP